MRIWEALQALDTDTPWDRRFRTMYLLTGGFFLVRTMVAAYQGNPGESLGWLMVGLPIAGIGIVGMPAVRKVVGRVEGPRSPSVLRKRWVAHRESVIRCGFALSGTAIGLIASAVSLRSQTLSWAITSVLIASALFAGLALFHWLVADSSVRSMLVMSNRIDPL